MLFDGVTQPPRTACACYAVEEEGENIQWRDMIAKV
jgi:hypothetical protein